MVTTYLTTNALTDLPANSSDWNRRCYKLHSDDHVTSWCFFFYDDTSGTGRSVHESAGEVVAGSSVVPSTSTLPSVFEDNSDLRKGRGVDWGEWN